MHDAKGKPLKVGDMIVIPAIITRVQEGDSCTLESKTIGVMPSNGQVSSIGIMNTKQVYRANEDDVLIPIIQTQEIDGKVYLK